MKKKLLIITFLVLMGLTGCSATKTNQSSTNNLFEKKKDCANLKDKIENNIKEEWNDNARSAWLDKIFYSPKQNSCLYTMQISTNINGAIIEIYNLFDAFTNEKLISEKGCLPEDECGASLANAKTYFLEKLAEYE